MFNPNHKIFAPNFLINEIFKHKDKIVKYSGMQEDELLNELYLLLKNINFINEKIIPKKIKQKAYNLCKDIDIKDSMFLSLAFYLKAVILSGDKTFKNGLLEKKVNIFFNY